MISRPNTMSERYNLNLERVRSKMIKQRIIIEFVHAGVRKTFYHSILRILKRHNFDTIYFFYDIIDRYFTCTIPNINIA